MLCAALTATLLATVLGAAAEPAGARPDGMSLTARADGIEVAFDLPAFDLVPRGRPGDSALASPVAVRCPGLRTSSAPGLPALPAASAMIALPPGAGIRLVIEEAPAREVPEVWVDPPASTPVAGAGDEPRFEAIPDAGVYATDAFVPEEPVAVTLRGVVRDVDFALVEIRPFAWNPVRRTLRIHDALRFRLEFIAGTAAASGSASERGAGAGRGRSPADGRPRSWVPASAGPGDAPAAFADSLFANAPVPPAWRVRRTAEGIAAAEASANPAASMESYKIEVEQDGIHRVTFASLAAAGFPPLPTSFADLRLELRGVSVPMLAIDADGDGRFSPGDAIEFHGAANPERWSARHVYWLTRTGGGRWMRPVPGVPPGAQNGRSYAGTLATARAEKDELYYLFSNVDPDQWNPWVYADIITSGDINGDCPGDLTGLDVDIDLPALAAREPGQAYQLRGQLIGRKVGTCNPDDQEIDLSLNGAPVGAVTWKVTSDGLLKSFSLPIDPALLVKGVNRVHLEQPTLGDRLRWTHLDWLELDYPRPLQARNGRLELSGTWPGGGVFYADGFATGDVEALDLRGDGSVDRLVGLKTLSLGSGRPVSVAFALTSGTGSSHHLVLTERSRLLAPARVSRDQPSTLRDPGLHGEYLVIAHPSFLAAARELTDYRASQGHSTQLVDLQDVYDEFSWGNVDAHAIRDFLAHAFTFWNEPPLYVVLVGDSSGDFRNNYGVARSAFYLPHLEYISRDPGGAWGKILAVDSLYQTLAGPDPIPDLLLGRLAVQTPAEVGAYVAKLKAYEALPARPWNSRYLLVVDDDIDLPETCPLPVNDAETFAVADSECYAAASGNNPDLTRVLVRADGPASHANVIAARNRGVSASLYFGHGSVRTLGTAGCVSGPCCSWILDDTDVTAQTNAEALPLSMTVACNVGDFAWQDQTGPSRCLGEAFLFGTSRGDIAFIGSTASTSDVSGRGEFEGLLDGLFRPASAYLPNFVPGARRLAGGIHFAGQLGFLLNPRISGETAEPDARSLELLGDPLARLAIADPPAPPRATCP